MEEIGKEMPTRRLPKVFIVGFQKCGTTALFAMLKQHSQISCAARWSKEEGVRGEPPKELNFFTTNYHFGLEWYESLFDSDGNMGLDATPNYISRKTFIARLIKTVPDARIIILMRDPVERVYSAWNHWNQLPKVQQEQWGFPVPDGSFEDNLKVDINRNCVSDGYFGLLGMGNYVQQLRYLYELVPENQIYCGFTENLKNDYTEELENIFEFLNLNSESVNFSIEHTRKYTVEPLCKGNDAWLTDIYRESVLSLEALLEKRVPWDRWRD